MTSPMTAPGEAHLLEIVRVPNGARVSLCPVRGPAVATLSGYEDIVFDPRELARLTYELRVQLSRANMRGQLDKAATVEIRKLGHLLFDELLPGSIKDWLRARRGGDLLIRTDESLVDIPWELLHTGADFLAMQMNLGRLIATPGAASPTVPRPLGAPYTVLLLADPCGDLDAAYEEGLRLRDVLDGQPFLRVALQSSEISRAYVRENIREYDILHFAGHAEIEGRGTGWLLSDGRLTAEDVERLTGGRPFPSLVFANACGSGKSRSLNEGTEATWSLARTLLGAGVRHFIGTHWDVPDAVASDFADRFYRGLCRGMPIGAALRGARQAIGEIHGEGAILWGSYCLYGDPGQIYFPESIESSRPRPTEEDLPVVDLSPPTARGIYHTLDPAEVALSEPPSDGLGLNPSLRNEAALMPAGSLVGESVRDMTKALGVAVVLAATLLLVAIGYEVYSYFDAQNPPPVAPPVAAAEPERPQEADAPLSTIEADLRAQEEAERQAPPKVDFQVWAQTRTSQRDVVEVSVAEGTRLRSGDNLRVELRSDKDIYAALVMLDGRDQLQVLFPHPSVRTISGDHIPAGRSASLPGEDLWYRLDKTAGVETLMLLASRQPLDKIDAFTEGLEAMADSRAFRTKRGGVVIRGVGGVTSKARAGRKRVDKTGVRTQQLAAIQKLATDNGIEVIQAVTYTHVR